MFQLSILSQSRFHPSSFDCSLSEYPSRPSFLHIYPGYLRILRVTSPLLIVITDSEGSDWVLATLPFIRRLLPYSIQWEWGNEGVAYMLLGGLRYSHLSLLHCYRAYLCSTSIYWGFYQALVSARQGMVFDPLKMLITT